MLKNDTKNMFVGDKNSVCLLKLDQNEIKVNENVIIKQTEVVNVLIESHGWCDGSCKNVTLIS